MVAQGLAQLRIGTKSLSGFSFKQVGFWFIHPLSFGSPPPLSRLFRPLLTKHFPSLLCTKLFSVSLLLFYIYIMFYPDYLLCRSIEEITWNTSLFYFLWFSSWCEDRLTLGRDLALVELGRRQSKREVTAQTRNEMIKTRGTNEKKGGKPQAKDNQSKLI